MSCPLVFRQIISAPCLSLVRRAVMVLVVVILQFASADLSSASLVGDLVHGEMLFKDFPGLGNMFDPAIKPGCSECTVPDFPESSGIQPFAMVLDHQFAPLEFIFRDVGFLDVTADIKEHSIDVKVLNISGSLATEAPFGWEIRITDMDWINGPPGFLTSAMVDDDTLFPGLTASVIDGGTGILIDFPGRDTGTSGTGPANIAQEVLDAYIANDMLTATISFTAEHIPEPASCVLFAVALVAIAGSRQSLV
jgi:hypothetical protein